MSLPLFLTIGLCAGVLAGLFGTGGGVVIVPALVLFAGYPIATANGTSLVALLLPIGLAGVVAYYQDGKISVANIKVGLLISLGMFLGSYIGARIALAISPILLKRAFCVFMVAIAIRMWMTTLSKGGG